MTTQILTTEKGTSHFEVKNNIEIFKVTFVDHFKKQAKSMILYVAPNGNWFNNPKQLFSFERDTVIMDGSKSEVFNVPMDAEIVVNSSIGCFTITNNKAVLS